MSKILNYDSNETIATGFVRPKVTSLFFDKIWIPESLLDTSLDFFAIPKEVLAIEKEELIINKSKIAGTYYNSHILSNNPYKPAGQIYLQSFLHNAGVIKNYEDLDFKPINANNINFEKDTIKFKYSKNRNHAIFVCSENFSRKYNRHISPIYHDLTEFEKDIQTLNPEDLYKSNSLKYKLKKPNAFTNKDAFSICIQDFPSIREDELSWEQVLEIRNDKKSIQQLKRFTTWTNRSLKNKSQEEIRETFESELEAYKDTLKEYGIKTAIGSFSTIVSSASSIASILANPDSLLLPMFSIMAVSISFSVNTYFSNRKNRDNPIAYLYNIEN